MILAIVLAIGWAQVAPPVIDRHRETLRRAAEHVVPEAIGQVERDFMRLPPLDALIVGVKLGGVARAYFLDDLALGEIRNDELAGTAIAVTW
jgi:Protein of unknown function (DUF3179)